MGNELIPDPPSTAVARRRHRLPDSLFAIQLGWHCCAEMFEPAALFELVTRHEGITDAAAFIESDCYQEVRTVVAEMARPATREEIKRELQILVGAFPNATKSNLEIFGRALALDVIDLHPCIEAVRVGCLALRRRSRFLPTISEVLTWIDGVNDCVMHDHALLAHLPAAIDWARTGKGQRPW